MMIKIFLNTFLLISIIFNGCSQKELNNDRPVKAPRGYMNETFLKIAYGLGLLDLIETDPEVPDNIEAIKDVVYKKVDSINLKLDIYRLKDLTETAPVLVFIHGGAWKSGKRSDYLPYLLDYAEKGYITATISYRLSQVAPFPAAVHDVKCAIRWIKAHAIDYQINPDKMAVIGGSAGGHLAMMAAYSNDNMFSEECKDSINTKVKAVVNIYGPTDLTTPYARQHESVEKFMGMTYNEDPQSFVVASPKTYICWKSIPAKSLPGPARPTIVAGLLRRASA